jgi:hypothetical protein
MVESKVETVQILREPKRLLYHDEMKAVIASPKAGRLGEESSVVLRVTNAGGEGIAGKGLAARLVNAAGESVAESDASISIVIGEYGQANPISDVRFVTNSCQTLTLTLTLHLPYCHSFSLASLITAGRASCFVCYNNLGCATDSISFCESCNVYLSTYCTEVKEYHVQMPSNRIPASGSASNQHMRAPALGALLQCAPTLPLFSSDGCVYFTTSCTKGDGHDSGMVLFFSTDIYKRGCHWFPRLLA